MHSVLIWVINIGSIDQFNTERQQQLNGMIDEAGKRPVAACWNDTAVHLYRAEVYRNFSGKRRTLLKKINNKIKS